MNILSIIGFGLSAAMFAYAARFTIKQFMLLSFHLKVKELVKERMKSYQVLLDEEKNIPEEDRVLDSTLVIPVGPIDVLELFGYQFDALGEKDGTKRAIEFISGKYDNTTMWASAFVSLALAVVVCSLVGHFAFQVPWVIIGLAFAWLTFLGILFV